MNRCCVLLLLCCCGVVRSAAERDFTDAGSGAGDGNTASLLKFAFHSPAWGGDTDDGLRLIALNRGDAHLRLDSLLFLKDTQQAEAVVIEADLELPAGGYGVTELDYVDLLQGNECIFRTLAEDWKLVEISNYTLNPSVRNLIIEDTGSFRIYQCAENVLTTWTDLDDGQRTSHREWVLFHFEAEGDP